MLNNTDQQRNANLDYNELPPHTSQNNHHPKVCKNREFLGGFCGLDCCCGLGSIPGLGILHASGAVEKKKKDLEYF